MTSKLSLQILVALGYLGMAFSGYLSYAEMYGSSAATCTAQGGSCDILGYPACIYGFFMFAAVAIIACAGQSAANKPTTKK